MFKNRFLVKYLVYMSLGWLATLLIKLNFSPFLSQGILTLPALAIIWLWWPVAFFLIWGEFKRRKNLEKANLKKSNLKGQCK